MTETELRLYLRGCYYEELEDLLVNAFADLEDKVQEIEQMKRQIELMKCRQNCMYGFQAKCRHRRCAPCSEWELKEE